MDIAFSDLSARVGEELGASDWFLIDQPMVSAFADLTQDHEWIHVDVDRANREFGGPIAHGYLTLSMIPALSQQAVTVTGVRNGLNYGLNKVRFVSMVRVGKRVRLRQRLKAIEPKSGGLMTTYEFTIDIEGEERPALIAEALFVLFPLAEGEAPTARQVKVAAS